MRPDKALCERGVLSGRIHAGIEPGPHSLVYVDGNMGMTCPVYGSWASGHTRGRHGRGWLCSGRQGPPSMPNVGIEPSPSAPVYDRASAALCALPTGDLAGARSPVPWRRRGDAPTYSNIGKPRQSQGYTWGRAVSSARPAMETYCRGPSMRGHFPGGDTCPTYPRGGNPARSGVTAGRVPAPFSDAGRLGACPGSYPGPCRFDSGPCNHGAGPGRRNPPGRRTGRPSQNWPGGAILPASPGIFL